MIERSGDWDKLDRVLEYVSNKDRIEYMTLQQYVQMARKRHQSSTRL